MTIGGSPGGTAGGIKTTTFALGLITAWCVLRRRNDMEVFKRTISAELLRRTVTIVVLYASLLGAVTLLLCVFVPTGHAFIDILFESCSACGTVGLSTGLTGPGTSMNAAAKYVIIAGMFVGRLGPLTLLLALTSSLRHVKYTYPTENIVIG